MRQRRRSRISRRQFLKAAGVALAAGARARAFVRALRKEGVRRERRRSASSSGATSCPATTPGSTASTRRSGARRTGPRSSSITWRRPRSTRAARPRPPRGKGTISSSSSRRRPPTRAQVIDHKDVVEEVERRHGKMIPLARRIDLESEDRKVLRVLRLLRSGSRQLPHRPLEPGRLSERARAPGRTCASGGRKIQREVRQPGRHRPLAGDGLEHGAAGRALVLRGRGAGRARAAPCSGSKETVAALEFVRALYKETDDAGGLHLGPGLEQPHDAGGPRLLRLQRDLRHADGREGKSRTSPGRSASCRPSRGPVRRIAAEHVMNCYVIWKFAENIDGAKQFLVDLVDHFADGFLEERVLQLPLLSGRRSRTSRTGSRRTRRPTLPASTPPSRASSTGRRTSVSLAMRRPRSTRSSTRSSSRPCSPASPAARSRRRRRSTRRKRTWSGFSGSGHESPSPSPSPPAGGRGSG